MTPKNISQTEIAASPSWLARWRERRRVRRLNDARRELLDAVYHYDKWTFALPPSGVEDAKERCLRAIRAFEELGGDVLGELRYGFAFLAAEAMPDTFERYPEDNRWPTRRIGAQSGRR